MEAATAVIVLSNDDQMTALCALASAGIVGSDARTCLSTAAIVAPWMPFRDWVRSLRLRTPEELAAQYGTDAIRAVLVLRSAAGLA